MTIREWLRRLAEDPDTAWTQLRTAAESAVRVRARGSRRVTQEAEDLAAEIVLAEFGNDCADLRRADPATPLAAWLRGVARHRIATSARRSRRAGDPVDSSLLEWSQTVSSNRRSGRSTLDPAQPQIPTALLELDLSRLPPRQREILLRLSGEPSLRSAARTSGTEWKNFRRLVRRGVENLRRPPPPAENRSWAKSLAPPLARLGRDLDARILTAWAEGRTHGEVARVVGSDLTPCAVKSRVFRLRDRARALGLTT